MIKRKKQQEFGMFLKLEVDIYSIYGYILGYIEENTIQVGNSPHNNGDKWPVVSKKKICL